MTASPTTRPSLIVRLADVRDDAAWSDFVQIYSPLLFRFACSRGLQEADAADVTQETLQETARAIGRFEHRGATGAFRAWLLTIARRRIIDFHRRENRQPAAAGGTHSANKFGDVAVTSDEEAFIEREYQRAAFNWAATAVQKEVQPSTWQAFWQTHVEHKTAQEVAKELNLSVEAIYMARSRVTARMRKRVQELENE